MDKHKRHAIVYHLISPNRKFDLQNFQKQYETCKNKNEKQICCQQFLGRFSFESVDLRHCSFVAEAQCEGNIDIFSAKNQISRPPQLHTEGSLDVGQLHHRLMSEEGSMSASLPSLPQDLLELSRKYKFQNNKKWSTQQLREDNDDHGDRNNRFQDHIQDKDEDQGSENDNQDDHDHDENRDKNDDKDEDGTKGQVEEGASGEKQVKTRRGRVIRRPERFTP